MRWDEFAGLSLADVVDMNEIIDAAANAHERMAERRRKDG